MATDGDDGPRHPGDEFDPMERVGWPSPVNERLGRMQYDHHLGYHDPLRPNDCRLCYPDADALDRTNVDVTKDGEVAFSVVSPEGDGMWLFLAPEDAEELADRLNETAERARRGMPE